MYLAELYCTVEKPYPWHYIREGSYSIHSAFIALGGQGEKTAMHSFLSSFFGVCPTLKLLKNVGENGDRENNEERIQKSTGSAPCPVS